MVGQRPPGPHQAVERGVLDVLAGLLSELGPPRAAEELDAEDSLDGALGLGSLERVELLSRLERAFGVRLKDEAVAEGTNARQLARWLAEAHPARAGPPARAPLAQAPTRAAPESARLLTDVLRWHAEAHPERLHLLLRGEEGEERPLSYGGLWARASGVAAALAHEGVSRGEPVALMLRTEEAFFTCFCGVLRAGGIPVPLYPPFRLDRLEEYVRRQEGILRNAGARVLLTFDEARRVGALLKARVPTLRRTLLAEGLGWTDAVAPEVHGQATDGALLQYTSGSTGAPKGVLLTHEHLLANIRAIGRALGVHGEDVAVSWLPLYHDMGLIGAWLMPLVYGVPVTFLSPLAFLARPVRWLHALHAHRGTLSAAPNFAYEVCASKVREEELEGLDLSAWRVALNGSEAVRAGTLERFQRRFGPYGLRPGALFPAYGLAEVGVALTFPPPGRPPRLDVVEREAFERRAEARPGSGPGTLRFVSCGRALPGYALRVVDEAGRAVGERVRGHLHFRGPSMTAGYYRNPLATRAVRHDGWMDSGDLGYLAEGELYVTGRSKELIIKAGRNLYPEELEEVVGEVPGVRKGCVAAFGVAGEGQGTERLVVVAETRERDEAARERLRAAVREAVVGALGLPADEVALGPPGAVRKTSSGKVRRGATREAWARGELRRGRRGVAVQAARLALRALGAWGGRAVGTLGAAAYSVYLYGLAAGLVAPVLAVGLRVVPPGPRSNGLVRGASRWLLRLAGCPPRVEGGERLREGGPWVLVARHVSYLDSVALLAALPVDFRAVVKAEAGHLPVVGRAILRSGHLPVERERMERGVQVARKATRLLRQGTSLLIFPEGTTEQGPGMLPLKLGAFQAAVETGRPLLPLYLEGTRRMLPRGALLARPARLRVVVGEPLRPQGKGWGEMVRLRERVREALAVEPPRLLLGGAPGPTGAA